MIPGALAASATLPTFAERGTMPPVSNRGARWLAFVAISLVVVGAGRRAGPGARPRAGRAADAAEPRVRLVVRALVSSCRWS